MAFAGRINGSPAEGPPTFAATRTTQMTVQTNSTTARNLSPSMKGLRSFTRSQRGQTTVLLTNCSVHCRHWMKFCRREPWVRLCFVVCEPAAAL